MKFSLALTVLVISSFKDVQSWSLLRRRKVVGMPPLPDQQGPPRSKDIKGHKDLLDILDQNDAWMSEMKANDPQFFDKLGATDRPNYLWIGCVDARVPANEIMGEPAGSVFVSRNVANLVVSTDSNLMAALQYAVEYLRVPHVIVCGHYECTGIKAAVNRFNHKPPLENWLRNIRDVYRIHRQELDRIKDPDKRHKRLVELNVMEQCVNVYKAGVVQRLRLETTMEGAAFAQPRIHGFVYDPRDGILKRVNVDYERLTDDLDGIYDLYADYSTTIGDMKSGRGKGAGEGGPLEPEPMS